MSDAARKTLRLNPDDNVVIAIRDLQAGEAVDHVDAPVAQSVPRGHKVASTALATGENVKDQQRYFIGRQFINQFARRRIRHSLRRHDRDVKSFCQFHVFEQWHGPFFLDEKNRAKPALRTESRIAPLHNIEVGIVDPVIADSPEIVPHTQGTEIDTMIGVWFAEMTAREIHKLLVRLAISGRCG